MKQRVAIVGAGVSGLTCGIIFAEHGYRSAIFAQEIGQRTTSGAAGALWFPYDAEPVDKVIDDGVHGLLADFYDVEGLAEKAIKVLRNPAEYRPLGKAARQRVLERFEKELCIGQLVDFFKEIKSREPDASLPQ